MRIHYLPLLMHDQLSWGAPKTFCTSTRTDRHGHVVAECTFHPGHENDHRDVHSGHTWK